MISVREDGPPVKSCPVCIFTCNDCEELDVHESSRRHHYNKTVEKFQHKKKSKTKDRHGVTVSASSTHNVNVKSSSGSVTIIVNWDVKEVTCAFTVTNKDKPVELLNALLLHPLHYFSLKNVSDGKYPQIGDGESRQINVTFDSPGVGIYCIPVCFCLKKGGRDFHIIREMVVEVKSEDVGLEVVAEDVKESPFTSEPWFGMRRVIPATKDSGEIVKKITEYQIPRQLVPLFKHNLFLWNGDPPMTEEQYQLLFQVLASIPSHSGYNTNFKEFYSMFFHTMLYLDEYTTVKQLHHYHMSGVSLRIVTTERVELTVPGLGEKRPSVIRGDIVSVRVRVDEDSWETLEYEGIIAEVRETVVWIKGFHKRLFDRLKEYENVMKFDVRFLFNRYPMYMMHKAIDLFHEEFLDTVLFPTATAEFLPSLVPNDNYPFFNKDVYNNIEQRTAVRNIVMGKARPAPYIVFGPPGTGKTNTIVEAILQVKTLFKRSYIVVCASSNAACDYITQRLTKHCTPEELLRLHSPSRDPETIPKDISKYSNCLAGKKFTPNDLMKFRIVVCTLINAGSKLSAKSDDLYRTIYHYTHVFIDEAGQAMEPETLVALAGILGPASQRKVGGQLILAGDPKQLGPVCASELAEAAGLGVSMLERLMLYCPLYERNNGHYNPLYITKLLENFRSHPSLLLLPNRLFYDEELKASCGPEIINDDVGSVHLLGKKNSVVHKCVFHGVIGQELREGKSPSFYNQQELDVVMQYITSLLNNSRSDLVTVKQSDIGVISPYIRQVYKLKKCVQSKGWTDVEVGTTETFQGREKRIILISTVRSNRNLLDYDKKYNMGFLVNKKRFNVAITRARSLLIVIGCPHILETNETWVQLIAYSKTAGSYKGCNYTLQEDSWVEEVLDRIAKPLSVDE